MNPSPRDPHRYFWGTYLLHKRAGFSALHGTFLVLPVLHT